MEVAPRIPNVFELVGNGHYANKHLFAASVV